MFKSFFNKTHLERANDHMAQIAKTSTLSGGGRSTTSATQGPTLTVRRDKGYADKIRKYSILLDGSEIGQLAEGTVLRQDISEGPHVVEARIDWCGSQPLEFDAVAGDQVVVVRSALSGWRVVLALWYVTFNRRGYLLLELQQRSGRAYPAHNQSA